MNWLKLILFLQVLLFSSQLVAQNKQLDKANKRYKIKKYAEAIPLYEQGLEKKSNLSAKVKLAYCYRINNNIEKAANLYNEIVQHKRAKPITWYSYGEALMSQGKYDEATVWLKKYTTKKPSDPKGWTLIESIEKVQTIEPYYSVSNIEPFAHNSESDDSAPVFFRDGIAFSSDRKTGAKIMKKKSSFTGREFLSIYLSEGNDDETYKSPNQISKRINSLNKNTGTIALSPDGTFVVFSRNSDVSNQRNQYNLMLYQAEITAEGRFRNVKLMDFCNNNANHMHPTFSPDGKTIFFTSDKSGVGGTDIFYSTLGEKGWGRARNLATPVNTIANEGFPFMSADHKLFFCSKGHASYGGFDIFVSQQDIKGNWSQPINIGLPINSPADDISIYLSKDLKEGMFASSREGGDDDIYLFDINGMYKQSSINIMAKKPGSEETLVSDTEDETIVVEPAFDYTTNTFSDSFEITIETLQDLGRVPPNANTSQAEKIANHSTENMANSISQNENRFTMTKDLSNSTPINVTKSAPNTDLPNSKTSPYGEVTAHPDLSERLPFGAISQEENTTTHFQEGLASINSPMTDYPPESNENKSNSSDANIAEMREHLALQFPQDGTTFNLKKIKFEPKKYVLTDDISTRLDELVTLMNEFPALKIEINAHTQSLGDDRKNMVFSIKRATAIAGYLIRKEIGTDRVKVMGSGETQLLNHCGNGITCSPEDHAINQRIELKILNQ
jgi:outer membrane protein OmpA-like peptidoglycan-associated protein